MRVINETGLDTLDDVETYTVRDTVQAVRCDDGVTITDSDGKTLASAHGDVVLVIDGDDYTPIPADIFDALYAGRGPQPVAGETYPTPTPTPTPETPTTPAPVTPLPTTPPTADAPTADAPAPVGAGQGDATRLVPPGGDPDAAGTDGTGTTEQPTPSVADLSQQ